MLNFCSKWTPFLTPKIDVLSVKIFMLKHTTSSHNHLEQIGWKEFCMRELEGLLNEEAIVGSPALVGVEQQAGL